VIDDLPKGWAEALLTEVAAREKFAIVDGPFGSDLKLSDYVPHGTVPVLTTKDLTDKFDPKSVRYISNEKFQQLKRSKVAPGDILIAKIGSIGKCSVYPLGAPIAIIPANLCKITVNAEVIYNRYLYWQVKSENFQNILKEITSATAQPAFSIQRLKTLSIKLAPVNEQRRIVAKLETLLSRVDTCQQRLNKIPNILKRFRQSVLSAACAGRLTADWREKINLPDWEWGSLSQQRISIQTGPFGSALHRADYRPNGIPIVNPMHIKDGKIIRSLEHCVSQTKAKELQKYRLMPGDIVLGRRGEMGRAAVVKELGYLCGTGSMSLKCHPDKLNSSFVCLLLRSPQTVISLQDNSVGSTMINLNQQIVNELDFPIVTLKEQQEVIRRVEALFAFAGHIEARYTKGKAHVDKIMQSILAKAFRGVLVPQDPNDEPADMLLKRIREGQLADVPVKKKREKTESDRPALLKSRKTRKSATIKSQTKRVGWRKASKK